MIIDTASPGRCKACQRLIYWRLEKSGASSPYNPPEPCGPCDGEGQVTIHRLVPPDEVVTCEKCSGRGRIQISHFATCEAAAAFRKRAK